jgi:hypothetical protein
MQMILYVCRDNDTAKLEFENDDQQSRATFTNNVSNNIQKQLCPIHVLTLQKRIEI